MTSPTLKTSIASRSKSLLGLGAKIASHELRHRVRERFTDSAHGAESQLATRLAQAKAITQSLSDLKGAAMKAGQLLSIDASDFLPPEATDILSKLQGKATPVPFEVLLEVLKEDLGPRVERLTDLDPTPAASASIGQVHRATVDGRPVAVKIQYPGIAKSIDSDMAVLEKLAQSWLFMTRSKIELDEMFEELRKLLHVEADYQREQEHMTQYRRHLGDDPRFVVPECEPDLCSPRVLTMSYEPGQALRDWMASGPPPAARQKFARDILDLYCMEFFEWGLVQTDPNPGNFLMRQDGRIVLLDFGATLAYEPAFRRGYRELLRTVASGERRNIIEAGLAFGILDEREGQEARDLFAEMLTNAAEPFHPWLQPFSFQDADYADRSRDVVARFTRSLKYSPPPRRLIFLHRKLGGLFQILKRLDVQLDLRPYWDQMVIGENDPAAETKALAAAAPVST